MRSTCNFGMVEGQGLQCIRFLPSSRASDTYDDTKLLFSSPANGARNFALLHIPCVVPSSSMDTFRHSMKWSGLLLWYSSSFRWTMWHMWRTDRRRRRLISLFPQSQTMAHYYSHFRVYHHINNLCTKYFTSVQPNTHGHCKDTNIFLIFVFLFIKNDKTQIES